MTGCSKTVDNYMMFMGAEGIYTNVIKYDSREDCQVCIGMKPKKISFGASKTLAELIEFFKKDFEIKYSNPSISSDNQGAIYLSNPAFASMYEDKLKATLEEVRSKEGTPGLEIRVQDPDRPFAERYIIELQ
mmetsp:Transcript_37918/g.33937  ORF Transcript_37918/g.33937 Transcript_37918/m.33937 type:complete len:132 (-) Transcript_37918:140-535(-)